MTVMEAAACGTPVVISDLPHYDPAVFVHEETVLRVSARNPTALAGAIERLATDSSLVRVFAKEDYGWFVSMPTTKQRWHVWNGSI